MYQFLSQSWLIFSCLRPTHLTPPGYGYFCLMAEQLLGGMHSRSKNIRCPLFNDLSCGNGLLSCLGSGGPNGSLLLMTGIKLMGRWWLQDHRGSFHCAAAPSCSLLTLHFALWFMNIIMNKPANTVESISLLQIKPSFACFTCVSFQQKQSLVATRNFFSLISPVTVSCPNY